MRGFGLRSGIATTVALAVALLVSPSGAAGPQLGAPEFQIDAYTGYLGSSAQLSSVQVAGDPTVPGFVVVWSSKGSEADDQSFSSVQARRLDGEAVPLGPQFQVNSYTTGSQRPGPPAIAPDGSFVVVWTSDGSFGTDVSNSSIQMQRYDSTGVPIDFESQVNREEIANPQRFPSAAIAGDGTLVVAWESLTPGGGNPARLDVRMRRFDPHGDALGEELVVPSYTTGSQQRPALSVAPDGAFVVSFDTEAPGDNAIRMRRFESDGLPVGIDAAVDDLVAGGPYRSAISHAPDGSFVVAWSSAGSSGTDSDGSVQARRFDATGVPLGTQGQVNLFTEGAQSAPSMAHAADGSLLIAWQSDASDGTDTDGRSLRGRVFARTGEALDDEFQVNTYTTGDALPPQIARSRDGDFLVVWATPAPVPGGSAVVGRLVHLEAPFFFDDFETGDLTRWLLATP